MATSSSAKKAAQLAARSSSKGSKAKNWIFPVAIVAIVALGIAVVAVARDRNVGSGGNDVPPMAQLSATGAYDHWHAAFSVNVCGEELGPYSDPPGAADPLGIHAHAGEALIHIHPFSLRSAGDNAKMGLYLDQVGIEVTDEGFKTPDGKVYKEGETTCGGEPTELTLVYWAKPLEATENKPDEVFTENFKDVRFHADREAYSLALLPVGEIPALPEGIGSLSNPSDVASEQSIPPELLDPALLPAEEGEAPASDPTAVAPADPATTETTAGSPG